MKEKEKDRKSNVREQQKLEQETQAKGTREVQGKEKIRKMTKQKRKSTGKIRQGKGKGKEKGNGRNENKKKVTGQETISLVSWCVCQFQFSAVSRKDSV